MKILNIIFLSLLLFITTPEQALAYLDPGSGSFIFQIIMAAVLGGLFTIRNYFKKIKILLINTLKRKNGNNKKNNGK